MNRLRGQVFDRDRYQCRALIAPLCSGRAEHAHHVWPVGSGGPDDLSNLIAVCFYCHRWIHDSPREAELLGLLSHGRSG